MDQTRNIFLFRKDPETGTRHRWQFVVDRDQNILEELDLGPDQGPIRRVESVSDEDQAAIRFFLPNYECDFPGCEELKREFDQEVAKAGGSGCKGCARGGIMRRFLPRVKEAQRGQA